MKGGGTQAESLCHACATPVPRGTRLAESRGRSNHPKRQPISVWGPRAQRPYEEQKRIMQRKGYEEKG
jgi:hypothetical protein